MQVDFQFVLFCFVFCFIKGIHDEHKAVETFLAKIPQVNLPCRSKCLREFIFADGGWANFCVLRELIFAIGNDPFFFLGINICDFPEVASGWTYNIFEAFST